MGKKNLNIEEEILTSDRVAKILDVTKRSVEDAIRHSNLQGYKKFNKWYILKSDLIEYIKSEDK